MKRTILIIIIVGLVGWTVYDFVVDSESTVEEEEEDATVGLEEGDRAPDFELTTLDGDKIKLSELQGERVLVNFWATWCPPCRAEIPDLQKFHENTDVNILAVNLTDTENSFDDVPKFAENFGMEFPILMDEESKVSTTYQIQPIPTSFMVDSKGIIQFRAMGAMNYDLMLKEYEKMD